MRAQLQDILACPVCRGSLRLVSGNGVSSKPRELAERLVDEGTLRCDGCQRAYPIQGGVPVLLVDGERPQPSSADQKWSFNYQWRLKSAGKLETGQWLWGKDLARISHKMRVSNCWHLDTGCGSGDHTRRIAEQNPTVQVVGLDRSDSVLGIAARDRDIPNLHYVRGNVLQPPLRPGSFRTIMAVGSLHATGNTKAALRNCVGLLEEGGFLSTWLYPSLDDLRSPLANRPRWSDAGTARESQGGEYHMWKRYYFFRDWLFAGKGHELPPQVLFGLCQAISLAISPFGHLLRLDVPKLRDRVRSNTFILFDDISPQHQDRPAKNEVFQWFREAGCDQVTYSFRRGGVFTALKNLARAADSGERFDKRAS